MNFTPYIGKPIVLITNEVKVQKELEYINLPGITYLMHSVGFPRMNVTGGKFCIVRDLVPQDLEDEDFSIYLKNMWRNPVFIDKYLQTCTVINKIST
ncbi:MAG: hypothetical protein V3V14_02975 [Saprospiraceae bacterium]